MEHEFLFEIFGPEKQDYLFGRCSVAPGSELSAETTKKVMFHLLSNRILRNLFVNDKQQRVLRYLSRVFIALTPNGSLDKHFQFS